jgi:hypothetical protein
MKPGMLVVIAAALSACAWKAGPPPLAWKAVAPGIEHAPFTAVLGAAPSFHGHAFRIDLDRADLHLVPAGRDAARRTVEDIVRGRQVVVATNASFFDEEGRSMGLAVDDGRLIGPGKQKNRWGALVVRRRQARIALGSDVTGGLAHSLVVQGVPRLVVGGRVQKLKPQQAERTAVCAAGSQVILVVASTADATAFAQFLAAPLDKGGLGCADALNLDGGPSTQAVGRSGSWSVSVEGGWGVPNALVATPP